MGVYIVGIILMLFGGALIYIKYFLIYKPKFKDDLDNKKTSDGGMFNFIASDDNIWFWLLPEVTFLIGLALIFLKTFGLIIDLLHKLKIIK
jgi:hypothetical protein